MTVKAIKAELDKLGMRFYRLPVRAGMPRYSVVVAGTWTDFYTLDAIEAFLATLA